VKSQITFTIPKNLMQKLSEYSEQLKLNKKDIIATALENYFVELKKKSYEQSFKRAANYTEQVNLANGDIGEYLKLLDK
jgi:metal-responsive CopG/Arc/MetJ family transcriptional regulator